MSTDVITQRKRRTAAKTALSATIAAIAAAPALLFFGVAIAQADPTPGPHPVTPDLTAPHRPITPPDPCAGGCESGRAPGANGPVFLNPQPLPPG